MQLLPRRLSILRAYFIVGYIFLIQPEYVQ